MTTTAESRCVVCGGRIEVHTPPIGLINTGFSKAEGYHCARCKIRYSEPPPKMRPEWEVDE